MVREDWHMEDDGRALIDKCELSFSFQTRQLRPLRRSVPFEEMQPLTIIVRRGRTILHAP